MKAGQQHLLILDDFRRATANMASLSPTRPSTAIGPPVPHSSAVADQDLSLLADLTDEISRLRGAGSAGAMPPLDHEGQTPEVEEALERMQSEMEAAKERALQVDRIVLQQQLEQHDGVAREEREALHGYLDELRSRQDETGDALRSADFEKDVDQLALEAQRTGNAGGGGPAQATVSKIIEHVKDPATFDALLEVQRLDEALESTERKQAEQATTFLTESATGGRPPTADSSRPSSARSTAPKRIDGVLGKSLNALNDEIGRLKGIEGGAAPTPALSASAMSSATSSTSTSAYPDGRLVVGGRRRGEGGKWISVADEARIEALLADDANDEDECAYGQGYRPPQEVAERLASIDAALDDLASQRAFADGLSLQTEPERVTLGSDSYLDDMKSQRAEAEALGRIRDRLAALHSTASTAPPTDEAETHLLQELLRAVHLEAERAVDSRPNSAASAVPL